MNLKIGTMLRVRQLCKSAIRLPTRGTNSCALRGKSPQWTAFLPNNQITKTYFGHKKSISTRYREIRQVAASNTVSNRSCFDKAQPYSRTSGLCIVKRDILKKSLNVRL